MNHLSQEQLEAGLPHILDAPATEGRLELIVRRPAVDAREELEMGELTLEQGLVGDSWLDRAGTNANPDRQLTVMNARVAALVAGSMDRWALAGDQLYVDFDISMASLPAGTQVAVGEAVIEVAALPHNGCGKFAARFGVDARRFVNSEKGRELRLRGANARVIVPGTIRFGDTVRRLA